MHQNPRVRTWELQWQQDTLTPSLISFLTVHLPHSFSGCRGLLPPAPPSPGCSNGKKWLLAASAFLCFHPRWLEIDSLKFLFFPVEQTLLELAVTMCTAIGQTIQVGVPVIMFILGHHPPHLIFKSEDPKSTAFDIQRKWPFFQGRNVQFG